MLIIVNCVRRRRQKLSVVIRASSMRCVSMYILRWKHSCLLSYHEQLLLLLILFVYGYPTIEC